MIAEAIRMNCPQFEEILGGLDGVRAQAAAFPEAALAHAESCGECARLLLEKLFTAQAATGSVWAVRE
jgi:hypothetical protein